MYARGTVKLLFCKAGFYRNGKALQHLVRVVTDDVHTDYALFGSAHTSFMAVADLCSDKAWRMGIKSLE